MRTFYHGTTVPDLTELKIMVQNPQKKSVLYLTTNRAYALFYIIDKQINHVTCGVDDNGIVQYKEQFPDQLAVLYQGMSGFLYLCDEQPSIVAAATRDIYTSDKPIPITRTEPVADVYGEIITYEQLGMVSVKRYESYTDEQKRDIYEMMVYSIFKNDYLSSSTAKAMFYKEHFSDAWSYAQSNPEKKQAIIEDWQIKHPR